jgi:hypothetical protein
MSVLAINTVGLGAIKTPMHKIEAHDFLKSLQPIGRMGKIDEVVDAVMYLNNAKFVTGEVLHVDGGAHAVGNLLSNRRSSYFSMRQMRYRRYNLFFEEGKCSREILLSVGFSNPRNLRLL